MSIVRVASPKLLSVPDTTKSLSEVQIHALVGQTGPTVMICENAFSGGGCSEAVIPIANKITITPPIMKN